MRRTLLALTCIFGALPFAAGCGERGPGGPSIELPVVTACGDVPTGPHVVTVRVNAESEIFLVDRPAPVSLLALKMHLIEQQAAFGDAGRHLDEEPGWFNSKMDVVIEGDAHASWASVGWVMQVASSPELLAYRFHFRVRLPTAGQDGAFAFIAPVARGMSNPAPFPDFEEELKISLCDGGDGTHPTQFHAALRTQPALADTLIHVDFYEGSTTVTVQAMLSVLDLMRRAGARQMTWLPTFPPPYRRHDRLRRTGRSGEEADLLAAQRVWIAENAQPIRPVSIDVARGRLSARPNPLSLPEVKRHAGAYGWTAGTVFAWEQVISDEDDMPFEEHVGGDDDDR